MADAVGQALRPERRYSCTLKCCFLAFPLVVTAGFFSLCVYSLVKLFATDTPDNVFKDEMHNAVSIYQIAVMVVSLVAMIRLTLEPTGSRAEDGTAGYGVFQLPSRMARVSYTVFQTALCGLSLVTSVFKLAALTNCLQTQVHWQAVLEACVNAFTIIYCIGIYTFTQFARKTRCESVTSVLLVMLLVGANLCLCVRCMTDAAQHTLLNAFDMDIIETYSETFCPVHDKNWAYAYDIVDRYFYTFLFLYSLYNLGTLNRVGGLFFTSSNFSTNRGDEENHEQVRTTGEETDDRDSDGQPLLEEPGNRTLSMQIRETVIRLVVFLCNHSIPFTVLVCFGLFVTNTYQNAEDDNFGLLDNATASRNDTAYSWTQTVYGYVLSIVAFLGFLLVRMYPFSWSCLQYKHFIFVLTAVLFHFLLEVFEVVDAVANFQEQADLNPVVLFLLKILLYMPGLYWQTMFVLKSADLDLHLPVSESPKCVLVYGLLGFIGVCSLERAVVDTVLTPATLVYANHVHDFFGAKTWRFLTRVLYPGVVFYRLHTALLCFEKTGVKVSRVIEQ